MSDYVNNQKTDWKHIIYAQSSCTECFKIPPLLFMQQNYDVPIKDVVKTIKNRKHLNICIVK